MGKPSGRNILLVEDEAIVAMAERQMLERNGFRVTLSHSGEEAVSIATTDSCIELVLMDINLGDGIDGTEAAQRILSAVDLPIVFLSSHTEPAIVQKTEGITSYGYIVKNSGETVLVAAVKMAFRLADAKQREKQRETALRHSEIRFRTMLNSIPSVAVQGYSADGTVQYWNEASEQLYGYASDEAIGRNLLDLIVPEAMRNTVAAHVRHMIQERRPSPPEELTLKAKDGTSVEVLSSHAVVNVPGCEPELFCMDVDISERKQVQEQLKRLTLLQQALVDMTSELVSASPDRINAAIDTCLKRTAQAVCADRAYIFDYDFDKNVARNSNEWCAEGVEPQKHELQNVPLDSIKEGLALHRRGLAHHVPDVEALPTGPLKALLQQQNIRSLLTVPMIKDGQCKGSVGFDSVRTRHHYSQEEQDALRALAGIIVSVRERSQFQQDLQDAKEKLQAAYALGKIGVWAWDAIEDRVTWSQELYEIAGINPSQPAPTYADHDHLYTSESMTRLQPAVEKALSDGAPYDLELDLVRTDGSIRYVRAIGGPQHAQDGSVSGLFGLVQDITESKTAHNRIQSLLEEKELLLHEVHHRVKNNMANVRGMLSLQADIVSDAVAQQELLAAASRIDGMLVLYDQLYQTSDVTRLGMDGYLRSLLDQIAANYSQGIHFQVDLEEIDLSVKRMASIGIITNELVTNACKYAFAKPSEGTVLVSARSSGDRITISVQDDGRGLQTQTGDRGVDGFGLTLVRTLVRQLHGNLTIESPVTGSTGGTRVSVAFDV